MEAAAGKRALRAAAEAARHTLHEAAPNAGLAIADRFFAALPVAGTETVSGYFATRYEADPAPLMTALRAKGCRIALPRVIARGAPLAFHLWKADAVPVRGAYGLLEPASNWPPALPDVLLVPLLAFDSAGYRLGYGGGYYDRTLKALRAKKSVLAVGIAFAGQETPELPRHEGDERLDWIVTEKGARRLG
jgi:5-formyltetrahydrofolate cyclo-ligase